MPISFTCPHCGTTTEVSDQYVGQSGPCAACGKTVTVGPPEGTPGYAGKSSGSKSMTCAVVACVAFVGILVIGGILAALLIPAVQSAREAARRAACLNNMKQIGLALHTYHEVNGTFPPAYTVDEDGNRMHSWRTLILPYMEQGYVFDQVEAEEAWNSPRNAFLAEIPVAVYRCPSDEGNVNDTNYVMIVGPNTAAPGKTGLTHQQTTGTLNGTIMVVEVTGLGIQWAEPRDLEADKITFGINDGTGGISSNHIGGACVLNADGSVHFLSETTAPQAIQSMVNLSGEDVTVE